MDKYKYITIISISLIFLFSAPLLAQEDEVMIENIEESASNIEADQIYINTKKKKQESNDYNCNNYSY